MWRSFVLKLSLFVMMVVLCVGVPIVNVEGVNWTSPTSATLYSVDMVSPSDGWAVGRYGTIIQWTGSEWVPEFPSAWILPLIILLSLITVALSKRRDFTKPKT
jgi:hypothetical protein